MTINEMVEHLRAVQAHYVHDVSLSIDFYDGSEVTEFEKIYFQETSDEKGSMQLVLANYPY